VSYTSFRPTDELWLTSIPEHWDSRKIKYVFIERVGDFVISLRSFQGGLEYYLLRLQTSVIYRCKVKMIS
jgi:hypothetical protein